MGIGQSTPIYDPRTRDHGESAFSTQASARASAPTLPYETGPRAVAPPAPTPAWDAQPLPPAPQAVAMRAARPHREVPGHIDVEMVIDDSSSMRGDRWEQAREATETLLLAALRRDRDGIEVSFLNHDPDPTDDDDHSVDHVHTRADVIDLFAKVQPCGTTPLEDALARVIARFWANYTPDAAPRSVVVVTDGASDRPAMVREHLAAVARELDRQRAPHDALGFSFAGIGIQPGSWAHTELSWLDDELPRHYGVRDIVDCTSLADQSAPLAERVQKILYGGIDRSLDAQAGGL